MECEFCGKISDDVEITIDPYCKELFGDEDEITICEDCYQKRCDSI